MPGEFVRYNRPVYPYGRQCDAQQWLLALLNVIQCECRYNISFTIIEKMQCQRCQTVRTSSDKDFYPVVMLNRDDFETEVDKCAAKQSITPITIQDMVTKTIDGERMKGSWRCETCTHQNEDVKVVIKPCRVSPQLILAIPRIRQVDDLTQPPVLNPRTKEWHYRKKEEKVFFPVHINEEIDFTWRNDKGQLFKVNYCLSGLNVGFNS